MAVNKKYKILIGIVSLIVITAIIVIQYLIANVLPYSPIRPYRVTSIDIQQRYPGIQSPKSIGLNYDQLNVLVEKSVELKGWFVKSQISSVKGTVVLLHGIGNTKYAMLPLAKSLTAKGFNCVLYDSRANGESGGINCTFGFYEKRDLSIVLDTLLKRYQSVMPFGVYGNSLGAAVAIQSMANDNRLHCGVVESPFATLREIVHEYFYRMSYLPINSIPDAALLRSEKIASFTVDSVRPEESAKSITRPVMVVHGNMDAHINWKYGRRVFDNIKSSQKKWVLISDGTHNNLSEIGGQQYLQSIISFFEQNIGN